MRDFEILGNKDFLVSIYNRGAYIGQITLNGKKILKESEDNNELHGGLPILIPYGDLVKDAKYKFNGKMYYLPKNAYSVGNFTDSIHGLVRSQHWSAIERGDDYISLVTDISDPGYPSTLRVNIIYQIRGCSLSVTISLSNIGENEAPAVVGAHPYFAVDHQWKLYHSESIKKLNYIDGVYPDGTLLDYNFNDIDEPWRLNLDNSFIGGGTLKLESGASTIVLKRQNMDYFEVYNGKYAGPNSVAIEPLSGAINAFNNGIGLKIIQPKKTIKCVFTIAIV